MAIAQPERFYEQDTKKYEIKNNKDFLNWLESTIDNGYNCFIKIEEMQVLIDNIVNWYEIKYLERELEYFEGTTYMNFQDIKSISDIMNISQLLFRLPNNQFCLMECGYRAVCWVQHIIHEDGKEARWELQISLKINRKMKNKVILNEEKHHIFFIRANHMTGEISKDYELEEYIDNAKNIRLDELLSIFNEKYTDELDYTELKECVYDHNCDIELRHRILQLVALKLLYSRNTIPEGGYERAKRFINEFNKELGINLSTEEIDEAINRDYTNEKKLIREDGEINK